VNADGTLTTIEGNTGLRMDHFAVVDFNNVIETNGDLMPMARQVRSAVAWVCKNAASFGGDPNRVYVSGHSSGGHLAGVVLATDWSKDFGLPRDVVLLDGKEPTDVKPGVPTDSVTTLRLPAAEAGRPVVALFNQERIVARAWPAAENRIAVAELTY